ncbi:MAG: hypothetical protein ACREA9_21985 [Pyrinomonadaceae bacterium]
MSLTKKMTLIFGILGILVPVVVLVAKTTSPSGFSPSWIFYVWPSYFILGGMAGKIDALTIAYLIVSILLNAALYAYVGSVVARLFRANQGPTTNRS